MTPPGNCVECGKSLTDLDVKHGWLTIQVSWRVTARVHTVCRAAFERRTYEDQKARVTRAAADG